MMARVRGVMLRSMISAVRRNPSDSWVSAYTHFPPAYSMMSLNDTQYGTGRMTSSPWSTSTWMALNSASCLELRGLRHHGHGGRNLNPVYAITELLNFRKGRHDSSSLKFLLPYAEIFHGAFAPPTPVPDPAPNHQV